MDCRLGGQSELAEGSLQYRIHDVTQHLVPALCVCVCVRVHTHARMQLREYPSIPTFLS